MSDTQTATTTTTTTTTTTGAGTDGVVLPEPFKLPARSTRGKRMAELIGDELEQDEEFWSNEMWADNSGDEDFTESGGEGADGASDEADSDFDAPEVEDEVVLTEEAVVAEERLQQKRERKQKGAYVDPALKRRREEKQRQQQQQQQQRQQKQQKAAKDKQEEEEGEGEEGDTRDAETRRKEQALARKRRKEEGAAAWGGERRRSLRESTVTRTLVDEEKRRAREAEAEQKRTARHRRSEEPVRHMTQEEKMAEAAVTEARNKRELEELLAVFQAQKTHTHRIEREYGAGPVTFLSRLVEDSSSGARVEATTLTFKNDADIPPLLATRTVEPPCLQNKTSHTHVHTHSMHHTASRMAPDPKGHVCAVTGRPAQFRDPKTGCWYSDLQAFRVLRARAAGQKNA